MAKSSIPIVVYASVLDEILDFSHRDLNHELGGFLVGGYYLDRRPYVEVQHFLPAAGVTSGHFSLKFTHATWSNLNRQINEEFQSRRVVGWQHTHPGFSVFLSRHDLFIHRNFFNQPWQIALVVDPRRQEFGFFSWAGSEIVNNGFVLVPGSPPSKTKF